ncbi:FAD-binding domain-containing protein [Pseudovirgaria hyperparasitica]|uniref:FAD-binding domain-containing protein n=1 Tax=Pseudovirgaria hyperparasitica TaxID=470096 RepID=A0A6A6VUD5_9PEZI|nr:FAD-binding domain-containing protein [Pseudovirgaria hyperparasitica]KAF2753344.1 FAD-binding domain-containing protein [Pseudovirgaria hyperparasitica]
MLLTSLVFLAATAWAAPTSDADAVCSYLVDKYPRYVAWDPLNINGYKTAANASKWANAHTAYWDRRNQYNRATCAFFPSNAEMVSDAVKQLNKYTNAPFAIKSGGHQFNKGFSSVDKGVLISFNENLSSAVRSSDGNSFVVGSGARWGDVYTEAGKTNQVVVGGRLSHIGVGGFTLGGGLSYYSAQYGLACDNVLNYEAVLPDGTIANINAQSTEYSDLFWALKGGGNRFAIVTRFTLKAHPAGVNGQVWGGTRTYAAENRAQIFDSLSKFVANYPDKKAALIPTHDFTLGVLDVLIVFMFYDGPDPGNVFADFDKIPSISSSTEAKTYREMTDEAGGASVQGFSTAARVTTFPNMPPEQMNAFYEEHFQVYAKRSLNNTVRDLDLQVLTFTPQPLSRVVAQASQDAGGNTLGLDPKYGDRIWIENDVIWLNPLCDNACPTYLKDAADTMVAYQAKTFPGAGPTNFQSGDKNFASYNPLFMNDAADYQNVYASYGSENEARLKSIQKKYDPNGFMFRQGGFKFF